MPQLGGLELLKRTHANNGEIAVMVLTQYGTIATAIEATRLGATDYVTKPFHVEELRARSWIAWFIPSKSIRKIA